MQIFNDVANWQKKVKMKDGKILMNEEIRMQAMNTENS